MQRLSDDTGGLIKVAWERMLGTMGSQGDTELQDMLPGLLAEFRQDAKELAPGTGVDKLARDVNERVRRATRRKSGTEREVAPRSWAFNAVIKAIESLSPLARLKMSQRAFRVAETLSPAIVVDAPDNRNFVAAEVARKDSEEAHFYGAQRAKNTHFQPRSCYETEAG